MGLVEDNSIPAWKMERRFRFRFATLGTEHGIRRDRHRPLSPVDQELLVELALRAVEDLHR